MQAQFAESTQHMSVLGQRDIVEKCTDWAPWERVSSNVTYQNLEGVSYDFEVGGAKTRLEDARFIRRADWTDIFSFVEPRGDLTWVLVMYPGAMMTRDFAQQIFDMFCYLMRTMAQNSETIIVSLLARLPSTKRIPLEMTRLVSPSASSTAVAQLDQGVTDVSGGPGAPCSVFSPSNDDAIVDKHISTSSSSSSSSSQPSIVGSRTPTSTHSYPTSRTTDSMHQDGMTDIGVTISPYPILAVFVYQAWSQVLNTAPLDFTSGLPKAMGVECGILRRLGRDNCSVRTGAMLQSVGL